MIYQRVFEYMSWKMVCMGNITDYCKIEDESLKVSLCNQRCEFYHPLDGNDMVLAINKMQEKGDFSDFDYYVFYNKYKGADYCAYTAWLFGSPSNFFNLMEEWLGEKK